MRRTGGLIAAAVVAILAVSSGVSVGLANAIREPTALECTQDIEARTLECPLPVVTVTATESATATETTTETATQTETATVTSTTTTTPAPASPSGQPAPIGNITGWTQVMVDEFTGTALDTTGRWFTPYNATIPSAPGAYWAPSQVKVRDGKLVLETAKLGDRWTSGGIQARQQLTYGKILIRTRMDKAAGVKYAHLLWPTLNGGSEATAWYRGGEIDFTEDGGGNRTSTTGTVIWFNGQVASGKQQRQRSVSGDFSQWHTMGVEWSPGKLVYTMDGLPFGTVTNAADNAAIPSGPMRLALQTEALLTCSQWNTCINSTTPALTLAEFDWVALYTRTP